MQTQPKEVTVEVLKLFKVFLKRTSGINTMSWFSFPIEYITHPDFFELTPAENRLFWWVVGIAAKTKNPVVKVSVAHAVHTLSNPEVYIFTAAEFHSMCEKLKGKQLEIRPAGYVYKSNSEDEVEAEETSTPDLTDAGRSRADRGADGTGEDITGQEKTKEQKKQKPPAKDWTDEEQAAATADFLNEFGKDPEMAKALRQVSPRVINTLVKKYARPWLDESLAKAILNEKSKQRKSSFAELRDLDVRLLSWFSREQKPQFRDPVNNAGGFFDKAEQEMATAGKAN